MYNKSQIAERRRDNRINIPITGTIDGCSYDIPIWSLGGLNICNFDQKVKVGDCVPIELELNFTEAKKEGVKLKISTLIEIIWLSRNNELGATFLNLTKLERELLQNTIDKVRSGEVTLGKNNIQALTFDLVPVAKRHQNEPVVGVLKKPGSKLALYFLLYLLGGGVLGFYTLRTVYNLLVNIQINSATLAKPLGPVVAPLEAISSKEQGVIDQVYVYEGMSVKPGQPIFSTRNDELAARDIDSVTKELQSSRLELAKAQTDLQEAEAVKQQALKSHMSHFELTQAQADLNESEAVKQQEKSKLGSYQAISQTKLDAALARVKTLAIQKQIEKNNLARFETLYKEGAVPQQQLDNARSKFFDVEAKLQEAQTNYKISQTAVASAQKGSFYDDNKLISDLPRRNAEVEKLRQYVEIARQKDNLESPLVDRSAEVEKLRQYVEIARQKVSSLEQKLNKRMQELQILQPQRQYLQYPPQNQNLFSSKSFSVVYKAPFPGTVLKVTKLPSTPVRPIETVMVLQRELEPPTIDAYLTQGQANQITIGGQATAVIPALHKEYQARISKIDRSGQLLAQPQEGTKGAKDRSVYVQLTIDNVSAEEKGQLITSRGMPVILTIPKQASLFDFLHFSFRHQS